MALPTPSFVKTVSFVYLVQFYHDCTWQINDTVESFSEWLGRVVPKTRDISTSSLYVCPTHKADSNDSAQCSQYVCSVHTRNPDDPAECSPFEIGGESTPPCQTFCLSDMLNLPPEHMQAFLVKASQYYAFVIASILNKHVPQVSWRTDGKLFVTFEL